MFKTKASHWLLFILLALIWGSSFILMKAGAEHLNFWQIGSIRLFTAGLVFLPYALMSLSKVPARKIPVMVLSGLLGNFFPAFLFAFSISGGEESSIAGIMNSTTPLFAILTGVSFFGMVIPGRKIWGVIIGFAGVVLLMLFRGPISIDHITGSLLILVATCCYGININVVGKYLKGIDPLRVTAISLATIAIPCFFIMWQQEVFSIFQYDDPARFSIYMSAVLGLGGSAIATALFYLLIRHAGGIFAALVTYAIPVVAILWGLADGEIPGPMELISLAVILSGVYMANREKRVRFKAD